MGEREETGEEMWSALCSKTRRLSGEQQVPSWLQHSGWRKLPAPHHPPNHAPVFTHTLYSQPPCDYHWCSLALRANLSHFFKLECYVSQNVLWFSCPLLPGSVTLLFYSSSTIRIPLLMHPQFILWLAVIHVSLSETMRAGRYILDTSKISKAHHSAWHTAGAG